MSISFATRPAVTGLLLIIGTGVTEAQQPPASRPEATITKTPSSQYGAGPLTRALLGSNWRDVWTTSVTAPVLDLEHFAGGLKFERRGGGFQSLVLHFTEESGWPGYRFRSVDKLPIHSLMPELRGTFGGKIWRDQTSRLFPGAPLLVPPVHEAVGLLHTAPSLYVMGDSPRLEAQRDTFAHMLGTMELKGKEAPDDQPGFAGSRTIKGTENFLDDINESRAHRLDEREFLAARLVDFLVNDPDRSADNFDWARFGEKGAYTWRPVPLDRDQAFVNADGWLIALVVRNYFPKLIAFEPDFDLGGLTHTPVLLDRRLLQRLDAGDFRDVAVRVQRAVTDSVIDQVVARIPAQWRESTNVGDRIGSVLRARRDALPRVAMKFYRALAGEVNVYGTAEADRIDIERHADGRVTVTIGEPQRAPVIARASDGSVTTVSGGSIAGRDEFYSRTFLPSETKEVRVYAGPGDDVAVIRGAPSNAITVRIIGGDGNDTLTDSTGGPATAFYDAAGSNELRGTQATRVDTRPWKPQREALGNGWSPDWGRSGGWSPSIDYNSRAGVIVGFGPGYRDYGFRRLPYHWDASAHAQVGTRNGRLGLAGDFDYRAENAPRGFRVAAVATQMEYTRFFGYGNNTADVGRDLSIVDQNTLMLEPAIVRYIGWRAREYLRSAWERGDSVEQEGLRPLVGEFRVGGVLGWIAPEPEPLSPLFTSGVRGTNAFGLGGARIALELDRTDDDAVPTSGWTLEAEASGFPGIAADAFATGHARTSVYVPLGKRGGPHVALRAGGALAAGDYPAQFAAAVGGRRSLRGYTWHRFVGDAAVDGGAELRVPVGTLNFLLRSQLGVFGLADAGRVWFNGVSDGGWHTGVGGGVWLAALGRSVSLAYARGEGGKVYLNFGMPY